MTNMQLAGRLLSAPRRFFSELAETPRFALPMWLMLLTSLGLAVWFYSIANTEWLIEQSLNSNPRSASMTDAQRNAAARFMTRGTLMTISVGTIFIVLFAFRLLEALWYKITGGATGHKRSYLQWFAFAWWTSTPGLINFIPAAILLLLSPPNPTDVGLLQPLSLNELFFHLQMNQPGYNLVANVSILMLLSLGLAVFGIRCWSQRSWLYSAVVGLVMPIVLLGGWAVIAMAGK